MVKEKSVRSIKHHSSFIGCASVSVKGFSSKISALCVRQTCPHGFGQIFYLNEFNIVKYDIKRLGFNFILGVYVTLVFGFYAFQELMLS